MNDRKIIRKYYISENGKEILNTPFETEQEDTSGVMAVQNFWSSFLYIVYTFEFQPNFFWLDGKHYDS